jgi:ribonucleoside-diphosphate reductase alpha chain
MTVQEWLGQDNTLGIDIWEKKYRYNNESFDEWLDRVSGGDSELRKLIQERKFLFGGRALSNRGIKGKGSMFNCYSSGYCPDELTGIMQLNTNLALTYKAQGGQGLSLSKIRPKGTPIGDRYTSDGIIPFLEMFNQTTSVISQGGSRKGALMVSLDIRHKEAEEFIKIKAGDSKISKANLSLEIDDDFMGAVEKYYKTGEEITLHESKIYNGHVVEYDIVPIKLYKMLVENCYDWGDPACLFVNRFRNYNLMEFDPDYEIETSNPCGEQPLPKDFCCNLGSLNLAEFVNDAYTEKSQFDCENFANAVEIAVSALDSIIDENKDNHALKSQSENSVNYRNIGLGVMGFGTCLMKLGITYGSKESKDFADSLFEMLFKAAVYRSNKLAKIKGSFPKYKDIIFDSEIIKNHFIEEEINELRKWGLRNCSLISIAPTGSIGTMLGVTGGCEPEFAIKYTRKTESLNGGEAKYYDVYCKAVTEYQSITGRSDVPEYFISSADINWKDRVEIQGIMQNHVDTAISSTVNLPQETPIEDVEQLYLYAWKKGIKGITIFRNGCKRFGILTTTPKAEEKKEEIKKDNGVVYNSIIPISRKEIGTTHGNTYCKKCACGTLYLTINRDNEGNIVESFVNTTKGGICQANIGAVNRMISLALRSGVKVEEIADQLSSINCPACVKAKTKGDNLDGISCADIISRTLLEFANEKSIEVKKVEDVKAVDNHVIQEYDKCPECGSKVKHEGGCISCVGDETHVGCGWSRCN